MSPYLSIVIPAHNEEARLPTTVPQVIRFLDNQSYDSELLIVDSGSDDRTAEIAEGYAQDHENVRLLREADPGKGLAVRTGMQSASGDYRFICDADLSMPIDELPRFLPPEITDVDIVIGSRESPGAVRYDEPAYRHFVGRIFNGLVRFIAIPGIDDTQCGFKLFRGPVADDLFAVQTLTGWTFDVELLYVARLRGYTIREIPIPWHFNPGSRVQVMRDSIAMFLDLFRIRYNGMRGRYQPAPERAPKPRS